MAQNYDVRYGAIIIYAPEWIDYYVKNEQKGEKMYGAIWKFISVQNRDAGNINRD